MIGASRSPKTAWRKSSYSNDNGDCIEVSDGQKGVTPVRDSKDPQGPALLFTASAFAAFITGIKSGTFEGI